MSNDSKIIPRDKRIVTPGNRQQRRAGVVDINRRFVEERKVFVSTIEQQTRIIHAMNGVLTKLAETAGTPVPKGDANDGQCVTALIERVKGMVEKEGAPC